MSGSVAGSGGMSGGGPGSAAATAVAVVSELNRGGWWRVGKHVTWAAASLLALLLLLLGAGSMLGLLEVGGWGCAPRVGWVGGWMREGPHPCTAMHMGALGCSLHCYAHWDPGLL